MGKLYDDLVESLKLVEITASRISEDLDIKKLIIVKVFAKFK